MKYSEIYDDSIRDFPLRSQEAAFNTIKVLSDRGGFDHWWHEIGERNRNEIFDELVNVIEQATNS